MKNLGALLILITILNGCSNSKPSVKDMKKTFIKLKFGNTETNESESKFLEIISFTKENAKEISLMGTQGYSAEYKAKIKFVSDCWQKISNGFFASSSLECLKVKPKPGTAARALFGPKYKLREKGEIDELNGKLTFEKTEKGWRAQTGEVF